MSLLNPCEQLSKLLNSQVQLGKWTEDYVAVGRLAESDHFEYSTSHKVDTWFDLASLTKAVCTAPLAFELLEEAEVECRQSLPGSIHFSKSEIGALIQHRAGLKDWAPYWVECLQGRSDVKPKPDLKWFLERSAKRGLWPEKLAVAAKPLYSDIGYIALGFYLEQRYRKNLWSIYKDFCTRHQLEAGLIRPDYLTDPESCAPSGFCCVRGQELRGAVHDENAGFLPGLSGHAGLFSTGPGLVAWLKSFARSDFGGRFLEANFKQTKNPNMSPDLGLFQLFGLDQAGPRSTGALFGSGRALGHLGFSGTAFWLNWPKQTFAVFLTNRVISGRHGGWFHPLRRQVFELLGQYLEQGGNST